jgi:AraC-like DNA-binding protein
MFYELQNSLRTDLIKTETGSDFSFPSHLHDSFEFIVVTSGEMNVTIDGVGYVLSENQALLVFPNQLHELETKTSSSHFLCIFSPTLVRAFSKMCNGKVPECNMFDADNFYIDRLMMLGGSFDTLEVKGVLYSICAEFNKSAKYIEQHNSRDGLLARIFKFVEENYKADCTLRALSSYISYNYVYLSRYFKQCTKITFIDYVNRYRINEACYLLKNSDLSVLQIAYECGFDSLRSFNRNFKKTINITPSEYQSI